jgi:hypothetical protein
LALTFEKLTFDVLDPERHERAFPWRFDRGHCGGKFAVDSPLEEDGFDLSVKIRPEENCGFPGLAISTIVPQTGAK